jgi:PAS domain S-box-containing protein
MPPSTLSDLSTLPREALEARLRTLEARYQALRAAFERQLQESALLDRVRTALARELSLDVLIRTVVEGVAEVFGYTHVSLYLLEGDDLVLQAQVGYTSVIERIAVTQGVVGRVVRSGHPVLIEDVASDPDFLEAMSGITSEVCVPVFDSGKVVGVFNVESTQGTRLDASDLSLMVALSEHIDLAISRARLYEEMRHSEELFRQLFEHAPIAMVLSDPHDTRIMRVNHAACDLLGYPPEELIGKTIAEISDPDDEAINISLRQALYRGEIPYLRMNKRYFGKDGRVIHGIIQVTLVRDSHLNPTQLVGQIVDISDLKRVQHELVALNQDLETRIRKRTEELQQANERLIELDHLKNRFISDMSHELRTPIANISTRVYLLEHDKPASAAAHLTVLKAHVKRFKVMLEEIIDFSRMQIGVAQPVPLRPVDLNGLVEGLKPTYLPRAQLANLAFFTELDPALPLIAGNEDRLLRLVANLLDNALKYTATGHLRLRTQHDPALGQVVLEVSDTGRGIYPEDIPHIFERFYRGREVGSSNIPGTGLGLAIVKEVVDQHRGQIEVTSEVGVGSSVRVRLPALAPDHAP